MKIWAVNTNIRYLDKGANIVLKQNRVVTWYKNELKSINKGDLVLSYNNGKNIVGVGYAISNVQKYDEDWANKTEEQWIDIDWIWKCNSDLGNPIKADNIKREDRNFMYSGTVINWTNGVDLKKLLCEIGKRKI